jgi:folate-binding protein YgfZ
MTSELLHIALGCPALLEFRGPDTVRFLNGQLTQDVRKVCGNNLSLPSCVTDAKGKLQFRVWLREGDNGAIIIEGAADSSDALEARITRYLIADDVEVSNQSGEWQLHHFIGTATPPPGVIVKQSRRYGIDGADWWVPTNTPLELPVGAVTLDGDELETFRIEHGVPAWGKELIEGMLPPEAGLDATDISYQKGCYIGQEVISRIKSAGKINKTLARFLLDDASATMSHPLVDADGNPAGELTSIAPIASNGKRQALGFLKRGAESATLQTIDGHSCERI